MFQDYSIDQRVIYSVLASLLTFSVLRIGHFLCIRHRRFQLFKYYGIPGPKPRLLDGSWFYYHRGANKLDLDQQLKAKYGKVFGIYFGDEPNLFITDLDMLKKIFVDRNDSFRERTGVIIDVPLTHGLFYAKYHRWRALRNMLAPSFAKFHRTQVPSSNTIKLMNDYIERKLKFNEQLAKPTQIDIQGLMKGATLKSISDMAIRLPKVQIKEEQKIISAMDKFIESGNEGFLVLAVIFPLLNKLFNFLLKHFELSEISTLIHKSINKTVDQGLLKLASNKARRLSFKREEQVIDTLVRLHHEGRLSRIELLGTAETILYAGYDTTSTTLTYLFWTVAKNQDVQEKLRSELVTHGIESTYLRLVIDETMRLYPVAPYVTSRVATRTIEIEGWTIPEGTKVIYNSWLMHRDPQIWANPENFDPSRFEHKANMHPCAFAPFGLGERRCLAYQFALLEMKMIICNLLLRYRIKLKGPKCLELVASAFITTIPREKVIIELERLD